MMFNYERRGDEIIRERLASAGFDYDFLFYFLETEKRPEKN